MENNICTVTTSKPIEPKMEDVVNTLRQLSRSFSIYPLSTPPTANKTSVALCQSQEQGLIMDIKTGNIKSKCPKCNGYRNEPAQVINAQRSREQILKSLEQLVCSLLKLSLFQILYNFKLFTYRKKNFD